MDHFPARFSHRSRTHNPLYIIYFAQDPPFSAPLCFPTEGNGHDHAPPAAVSSMAPTVVAGRPRQPWPDTALLEESASGWEMMAIGLGGTADSQNILTLTSGVLLLLHFSSFLLSSSTRILIFICWSSFFLASSTRFLWLFFPHHFYFPLVFLFLF